MADVEREFEHVRFSVADEPGAAVVRIAGELDISGVPAVAEAVAPILARPARRLVVDVRELRFADSSALALWVQWATAMADFELRGTSALLRKVIERMGLADTLKVAR
jgi:anti-sigma B factor antagonist/stage II sporulation protein AA (anti-sigma F factor antagonist)